MLNRPKTLQLLLTTFLCWAGNESMAHAGGFNMGKDNSLTATGPFNQTDVATLEGIFVQREKNGSDPEKQAAKQALATLRTTGSPILKRIQTAVMQYNTILAVAAGGGASKEELEAAKSAKEQALTQAKEAKNETAQVTEKLQQEHQQREALEQRQQALVQATAGLAGLSPEEAKKQLAELVANSQKAISGFSDSLYWMKFSADEDPEFSKSLEHIAKQIDAARKIKAGYEEDKEIGILTSYLSLSKPVDLEGLLANINTTRETLLRDTKEKLGRLEQLIGTVRQEYQQNVPLTSADLTKYLTTKAPKILDDIAAIQSIFPKLSAFLTQNVSNPSEFKKGLEKATSNLDKDEIQKVFTAIGVKKVDKKLLLGTDALTLYARINDVFQEPTNDIEALLTHIDEMRVLAFELLSIISKEQFIESGAYETNPSLKVKTLAPSSNQISVETLLQMTANYDAADSRNSMYNTLEKMVVNKVIPYEAIVDFKAKREPENKVIQKRTEGFADDLISLNKQRAELYEIRKVKTLSEIIKSNLFFKDPTITSKDPRYKSQDTLAHDFFKNLEKDNKKLLELLSLFKEDETLKIKPIENIIRKSTEISFTPFWHAEMLSPHSKIYEFYNALQEKQKKDEFQKVCETFFSLFHAKSPEQKAEKLIDKIIEAHDLHKVFMAAMRQVSATARKLKFPKGHKLEVTNKINQIERLLQQNPTVYLTLPSNIRATNYAYNFPMLSDEDLQPLKSENDLWKKENDPQTVDEFFMNLKSAHAAYIAVRDAIKAINPIAQMEEAKSEGFQFGGFLDIGEEKEAKGAMEEVPGGPPGAPEFEGAPDAPSGPPGAPEFEGAPGAPEGPPAFGGLPTPGTPRAQKDVVLKACNACASRIEDVIGGERKEGQSDSPISTEQVSIIGKVKESVLNAIRHSLATHFKYLDQSALATEDVTRIVNESCTAAKIDEFKMAAMTKFKTKTVGGQIQEGSPNVGQSIADVIAQARLKKQAAASVPGKEPVNSAAGGLHHAAGGEKDPFLALLPFEQRLIDLNKSVKNLETRKQERVQLIKVHLKEELMTKKSMDEGTAEIFINGFADEELLAFPTWILIELQPKDFIASADGFQLGSLTSRKFSKATLEIIADRNRFRQAGGLDQVFRDQPAIVEKIKSSQTLDHETLLREVLNINQTIVDGLKRTGKLS